MDSIKNIISRRSIRNFKPKKVDKEDIMMIIESGIHAPTAGNLQDLRFIVVTDREIINQLPEFCMDQYWIATAPAVIIVCSRPQIQEKWFGERGRHVFATQNAAAATQNILLTANALNLGACWIGGFNQKKIDWLFGVKNEARVESIIPVGYPAEKPDKKKIENISHVVYFEKFGQIIEDLDRFHNDYSNKTARYLKNLEKNSKNLKGKAENWFAEANKKIKAHVDKYNKKIKK